MMERQQDREGPNALFRACDEPALAHGCTLPATPKGIKWNVPHLVDFNRI